MSFQIKLPLFEGPFDLLLFFIERDELDINDIPISKITADFLDYIHRLEEMNIEVASEFILVAATLMSIKARMLIPRKEVDEEGNEIDPRDDLVQHLLEYKKYKSVVSTLAEMEEERFHKEKRGNVEEEYRQLAQANNVEAELRGIDLYKLLKVYQKVLKRQEAQSEEPKHQVIQYDYTVDGQKQYLMDKLHEKERVDFSEILEEYKSKIAAIFNFLAILELLQLKVIDVHLGLGFNNFWLIRKEGVEAGQNT